MATNKKFYLFLLIILVCFTNNVSAQFVPFQSGHFKRLAADTLYNLTGNGVPTSTPNSYRRTVMYYDSTNHIIYFWKPEAQQWATLESGSGGGGTVSLDTTVTADGTFTYDFTFPVEPWVYNDLPNLDSVRWISNVITFYFSEALVSPQQLHFQVIGGSGGSGGDIIIEGVTQLQLNDSMAAVRGDMSDFATQQALEDTAAQIRADFPSGGGSGGVTDFSLLYNNSGSGDASGTTFNGSVARTLSYNSIGAVPTARTISTTSPMTGGGALTGNLTISMPQANGSTNGWMSAATFNTFMAKVDQGNVTSSGLQMTSARLLGRWSAGTGALQEITLGANLSLSGAGVLSATGGGGGGGTTDFPLTFATSGGAVPGTDFNGAATVIISPTSIGAVSTAFTLSTTSPLLGGGNFTANRTLSIQQANTSNNGYLSATDWNTFNTKLSAGAITSSGLTMSTARLLGRYTAGTGAPQEITVSTGLNLSAGGVLTATGGGGGAALGLEYYSTYTALTDGATINVDYDDSGNFTVTIGGNRTLNFQNAKIGVPIYITVTQDGSGNRFLTFPNNTKFVFGISDPGSHILNLSSAGGSVDIICVVKDPVNYNVWMSKDMRL